MALSEATVRVVIEVTKFEQDLRKKVKDAATSAAKDFDKEMTSSMGETGKKASDEFSKNARKSMGDAGRDAGREFMSGVEGEVSKAATAAGNDAGDGLSKGLSKNSDSAGKKAGKNFASSFNSGFIANNPLIALGAVLGTAFSTDLGPAVGSLAILPSLLLGVAAAAGVTVAAFKGVGDALKAVNSDDIDKLNTSMGKLTPSAQAFIREFSAARPILRGVREDLQEAFFSQVGGVITDLANDLAGPLHNGLVQVATSSGLVARELALAFIEPAGAGNLARLFSNTSKFLDRLAPGLKNTTSGFLDFVGATSPGLIGLGNDFNRILTQFGAFLTRSAQSGQALQWVTGGVSAFKDLVHEVTELVKAVVIIAEAIKPLAFGMSGLLGIVENLVGVFGDLPGPIQTAALAALLFTKSGLPDFLKKTGESTGPVAGAIRDMGSAFSTTNARVRDLQVFSGGAVAATNALGRAADTAVASTAALGRALGSGLLNAASAVNGAISRTATTIQTGFIRASIEASAAVSSVGTALRSGLTSAADFASNALDRTAVAIYSSGTALRTGLARATIEANAALGSMSNAATGAATALRGGLLPTAAAIDATTVRASAAIQRLGGTLGGALQNGAAAAGTALSAVRTSLESGLTRAAVVANSALDTVGSRMRGALLSPLSNVQSAYRTASDSARTFSASQASLNAPLGASGGLLSRFQTGLSGISAVAAGTGAVLRTGLGGAVSATGGLLNNFAGAAAGVGKAVSSGIGSAVTGVVGALGGPFGLALAAASVGLSLLSSAQDQARAAAASHAAEIANVAETLNKQTGAVTAATRQALLNTFASNDAGDSARKLGISLGLVSDAASGGVGAQDALYAALRKSAEATGLSGTKMDLLKQTASNLNIPIETLENALLGNAGAVDTVRAAYGAAGKSFDTFLSTFRPGIADQANLGARVGDTARQLYIEQQAALAAAAAMTPGQRSAQQFADALGILRDKASDADAKARALADALNILAGGTVNAEVAQGRFTDLISQLSGNLKEGAKGLKGMGDGLVDTSGKINTQTQAGAFLINTYKQITDGLTTSAAATVQAGQASGNLNQALGTVAAQTQAARDQFIATARELGLNATQANQLADSYGLIPSVVLTTVTTAGSALNTQLQVEGVFQRLKDLPPNTPVTVTGLTADAIAKLNAVGIKTETLPDGQVKVTANTSAANIALQSLVNSWQGTVIRIYSSIFPGHAAGAIVGHAEGAIRGYAQGGLRSMPANRAEIIKPNTFRVIGDRARGDEAFIPITDSARSKSLLAETARRMGFSLLADGGIVGNVQGLSAGVSVAAGAIVINAPFADPELVAKATLNKLAQSVAV